MNQLRLMRNEIFARYGYIFKSDDLKEYFSKKIWYAPEHETVDHLLTEIDKGNIKRILHFENSLKNTNSENLFYEKTESYIKEFIYNDNHIVKSLEISYMNHYKLGKLKLLKEETYFGGEGTPTSIFVETIKPRNEYWSTTKYFNDIRFYSQFFRVVKYGCCGDENYFEFYNLNDELILQSNEKYFFIEVPNSKLELFAGFNNEIIDKGKLILGKLTLSSLDGEINSIVFKAESEDDYENMIPWFTPEIEIVKKENQDEIKNDNKLVLWSKNEAEGINMIDGFSLKITFKDDSSSRKCIVDIPVISGSLLGSTKKEIFINVELKE